MDAHTREFVLTHECEARVAQNRQLLVRVSHRPDEPSPMHAVVLPSSMASASCGTGVDPSPARARLCGDQLGQAPLCSHDPTASQPLLCALRIKSHQGSRLPECRVVTYVQATMPLFDLALRFSAGADTAVLFSQGNAALQAVCKSQRIVPVWGEHLSRHRDWCAFPAYHS